ncbi:MAG: OmpA family protein, partial [Maribacter sp.]|uniref:OmpA family protein n=1 Tax=Maribacter sp. TaxID=1897614 RepID=UPI003C732870
VTDNPVIVVQPEITSKNQQEDVLRLQRQLDSLRNMKITEVPKAEQESYNEEFMALQEKLSELQNEMVAKKNAPTDYFMLSKTYKDYKKQIFFANNSTALNAETTQIIDGLYSILDSNENIDVLVKGFASNTGSTKQNEKISMQRTEEVKKALILKGIHPTRILTQYHGIDYMAANETDARRVEISLLIRK